MQIAHRKTQTDHKMLSDSTDALAARVDAVQADLRSATRGDDDLEALRTRVQTAEDAADQPLVHRGQVDELGRRERSVAREVAQDPHLRNADPEALAAAKARGAIRLLMLLNDTSYRNLIAPELAKGFGFLQGKGQTTFALKYCLCSLLHGP